jgi:geranylgeranyl pyrophosphate synthase
MRDRRESIEQGLQKILPERVSPSWISWVADEEIEDPSLEVYDRFCEPGRDLLKRGGKRWRPLLMAYVAEILGGTKCAAIAYELAAVVELPHTGSLIIDDIEDDSLWRRGAAAVHMIYGSDLSINAGNLLYYLPTRIIDTIDIADGKRLALYRIYARYLRRVHLGQGLDIAWHNDVQLIPSVGEYEQMCRFKTGCLAGMSAEIGACIATDDQQIIRRSGLLAEKIGVGFQIKDDVINLRTGNPGKHRGDDIVENKKSLPVILYLQRHPERTGDVQETFEQAKAQGIFAASEQIEQFIEQMLSSGVVDEADRRAAELLQEALDEIYDLYPPCSARDELTAMLEGFLGT